MLPDIFKENGFGGKKLADSWLRKERREEREVKRRRRSDNIL
jgi:hypothetical protein